MSNRAVERLGKLLEKERIALLAGDLAAVGDMVTEKEELAGRIETDKPSELRGLSSALARNSALLAAARDGVADVVTTIRKQRAARTTLSTYDSSGKPSEISGRAKGTERRF